MANSSLNYFYGPCGAFIYASQARGAFFVIYARYVIFHSDSALGTGFLAYLAADASGAAVLAYQFARVQGMAEN
jgi:hypothetical protein